MSRLLMVLEVQEEDLYEWEVAEALESGEPVRLEMPGWGSAHQARLVRAEPADTDEETPVSSYPTMEQAEAADQRLLSFWLRWLKPATDEAALVRDRILERQRELRAKGATT